MKTRLLSTAAAGFLALAMLPAQANYMRCGSHLLDGGQRNGPGMYEVLMKCGKPTERFGTTWIYKRGGTTKVVHFDDSGRLTRIGDGRSR